MDLQPCGDSAREGVSRSLYCRSGKRLLDISLALMGLVIALPFLALGALAVWLESGRPIFFMQWRVGRHSRQFKIIKLRTMRNAAEVNGAKVTASNDPRITAVGKWLRRTKVDEIPQLFNILKGEMSFVGPRPEIPEYVMAYTQLQTSVLNVRPGLTGPAALAFIDEERVLANHLNEEDFYRRVLMPAKLELDLAYCKTITLLTDLKLISLTLLCIFDYPTQILWKDYPGSW